MRTCTTKWVWCDAPPIVTVALFLGFSFILAAQSRSEDQTDSATRSTKSFTLEEALDFPYAEELSVVASPKTDRIAWVENRRGVRNVFGAEAPQWKPHQLTAYKKDDGQAITDLTFSGDGNAIVYLRGGPKNAEGEAPDPDGDPGGAKQAIWKVSWLGNAPSRMDLGNNPKVSPDSSAEKGWVAYTKDRKIWLAPLHTGTSIEVFAQGVNTDPEWSPDGKRLAFVSARSGHSLIAIYDVNERALTYVQPSVDRDTYPRWSPDGRQIAFVRSPSSLGERRSSLTGPDTPRPWAIWVYDVGQQIARQLWHSGREMRDSLPTLPNNTLLSWGSGNTVVFSSEQDGWQHLYKLSGPGSSPQLLTPGSCEYDYMALSFNKSTIFYSSNCGDIDRRHLWKVALDGGAPEELTPGEGLEWWPVPTSSGKWLAFLGSDAKHPAAPIVMSLSERQGNEPMTRTPLTHLPSAFPINQLVTPKQLILHAADGMEIHTQLFLPPNIRDGQKHPAIVHMHGGPLRQMLLGWHPMFYYSSAYAVHQLMVNHGYVVVEVNYRSGIGYGEEFRMAKGRGSRGATEYQDIVAAGKYLQNRPDVDASRIGLWGGSYGGFLTAMGLARNSDIFSAGVDFHGVHDWTQRIGLVTGNTVMPPSDPDFKVAKESSPIASIATWRSPVLLIQGDDDRNVDFGQLIELVPMLRRQGVEFEQLILPDEVHDFLRWESWIRADHATITFFNKKLGIDVH